MRSVYTSIRQKYAAPTVLAGATRTDSRLTASEQVVLHFFAVHRIATANLVMRTFSSRFAYHRKAIRCLRSLSERGLLCERRPRTKFDDIVFTITQDGYRACRDLPNIDLNQLPYSYSEPTGKQADHELLITQTAVLLYEYGTRTPGVGIVMDGRFGRTVPVFDKCVPDYWYVSHDANGFMFRVVEVISGVESSTDIRNMFHGWDNWWQRSDVKDFLVEVYRRLGAAAPLPEFQVHCILHSRNWKYSDAWKERLTMQQTFHVSRHLQGRVWTTTTEALSAAVDSGLGINHPVWHRGADLVGKARDVPPESINGKHTRWFDQKMQGLAVHPLFA